MELTSIDLFSGVGGLTLGLEQAGFKTKLAFEIDRTASEVFSLNHPHCEVITRDIKEIKIEKVRKKLNNKELHLLAGCPPCQGFSSIRRLNRPKPVFDERNSLISEYIRMVEGLQPLTIMMENVPGLALDNSFKTAVEYLTKKLNYFIDYRVVNIKDYGVPQSRKRLVMVGSRLGSIKVAAPEWKYRTVRDTIGNLPTPEKSKDALHKIFPKHSERIQQLIRDIPHNGGSRKDLGENRQLKCHQRSNIGFNDVYGRLKWDKQSTTITGGCLNPSKGRFLHPDQDRCISAREAALLQSFPESYIFPTKIAKTKIALMIGNALPPEFSRIQAEHLKEHIIKHNSGNITS